MRTRLFYYSMLTYTLPISKFDIKNTDIKNQPFGLLRKLRDRTAREKNTQYTYLDNVEIPAEIQNKIVTLYFNKWLERVNILFSR